MNSFQAHPTQPRMLRLKTLLAMSQTSLLSALLSGHYGTLCLFVLVFSPTVVIISPVYSAEVIIFHALLVFSFTEMVFIPVSFTLVTCSTLVPLPALHGPGPPSGIRSLMGGAMSHRRHSFCLLCHLIMITIFQYPLAVLIMCDLRSAVCHYLVSSAYISSVFLIIR